MCVHGYAWVSIRAPGVVSAVGHSMGQMLGLVWKRVKFLRVKLSSPDLGPPPSSAGQRSQAQKLPGLIILAQGALSNALRGGQTCRARLIFFF